jgi:hypothetical protein
MDGVPVCLCGYISAPLHLTMASVCGKLKKWRGGALTLSRLGGGGDNRFCKAGRHDPAEQQACPKTTHRKKTGREMRGLGGCAGKDGRMTRSENRRRRGAGVAYPSPPIKLGVET